VEVLTPGTLQTAESNVEVVPFRAGLERRVVDLILGIQHDEFGIQISAEQQPDLGQIPTFYQVRNGNFWVALRGADVVGTISLLDIGSGQGALRKMFVHPKFRSSQVGTAKRLLDTLIGWSVAHSLRDIFLGTTSSFLAAHRFYEKNGFCEIAKSALPASFPIMEVDTKFYHRCLA
jgi:N-acetylglutamate synthase-like GNAT family acetyltransferase